MKDHPIDGTVRPAQDVRVHPPGDAEVKTRLFRNGNSQAVRIPAELAYPTSDMELDIERVGDELRIRPAARLIGDVAAIFASFSPGFAVPGRGEERDKERAPL